MEAAADNTLTEAEAVALAEQTRQESYNGRVEKTG
jgi:hypothetical protein